MQNINLWLAVDRLRTAAEEDPESARELRELIALIETLDGAHGTPATTASQPQAA
ncbi:hypothetical protein [Rhodovibrio salinarum]|uniref:hypothetical protein n=1 Tax=Rhodovibrio salinarum TaxID=1087 RepID=UPI0004B93C3C|nr:hypothetical protein [Rhodovibrio salinarum]